MGLPGNLTTITVTGSLFDAFGNGLAGTVTFAMPALIEDAAGPGTFPPVIAAVATLVAGTFSVVVPCSDNAAFSPTSFGYTVTLNLGYGAYNQQYTGVAIPHTLGSTVDLSQILPPSSAPVIVPNVYGVLATSNTWAGLQSYQQGSNALFLEANVSGDSAERFEIDLSGKHQWGSGGGALDTDLYRSAAASLKTDGAFTVAGALNAAGTSVAPGVGAIYSAFAYGAVGDYATDDTTAINNAATAISAAGGGVLLLGQHVVSGAGIIVKSNVTFRGIPGYSKLKNSTSNTAISSSVAASNITIEDLLIEGPVTNAVTVPTRARTTSGPGTTTAIWIDGSLDTTAMGAPVITNVVIRNVTVQNCTSLPIRIFGVTGRVLVTGSSFYNSQDVGFGFNQEVICANNHSLMSQDNGFSISRGNNKVTCVGNTVELAAYHGIWLSGFTGSAGPTNFACTGNGVYNVGECGILLQDAPKYGVVSGNTINKNYIRGEAGAPTDSYVSGIMIRGNSTTPGTPGTSIAYGLKVSGNTVIAACDAGISYDGATSVAITDNLILDCGTNLKSDGVTVIGVGSTTQNIGILCQQPATAVACIVRNNDIIDERATPYTNWGLYPTHVSNVTAIGNTMTNCRNSSNLPATLMAYNDERLDAGQETLPRWAANNSSSITASSGTLRIAYFVARRNATVTALRVLSGSTAAGATPTLVRFGLYSVDSSGNLTLMSGITSDTSIFAGTLTAYQRTLGANQSVVADQMYAIAAIVVTAATAPTIQGALVACPSENQLSPLGCGVLTGQTDLPSSITAGSVTGSQSWIYAVAVGA